MDVVDLDLGQLRALSAAVSEGTLDAAARRLHLTPSAVSLRLKALEAATGRVLLVRTRPVRVTASGEAVLRLAHQVELLAGDTARELGAEGEGAAADADGGSATGSGAGAVRVTVPVAVNADSLATWVLDALAPLTGDLCLDLRREDEARTSDLLRAGEVMAAVTADASPVPGCTSTPLGAMRYRPMASPEVVARWFPRRAVPGELAVAPVVRFDRTDDLQHRYLRRRSRGPLDPPAHLVPSSADFLGAVLRGYGWGMVPDLQGVALEREGRLVVLDPRGAVDVGLHWQQWRLRSPSLDRVAAAVVTAGRARLVQPRPRTRRADRSSSKP